MDEMMDFLLESDPVILRGQYQEMLGLYLLRNGLNEWIDWEKGEAHFDKDSFRKVIEATGRGNADVNQAFRLDESIGCGALREWWISEVPSKLGLLEDDAGKNNKAKVLFRAPGEGYEGAVIHGSGYLAISHVSETQKGAAEFYRYVFTMQENMNNWRYYKIAGQMPVVRSGLEEHLKIKENPEDELTRLIWDFVSGADQPMDDGMVQDVIWSELRPYLAGEITAEKAAEHVQNRVSIYLAEQG